MVIEKTKVTNMIIKDMFIFYPTSTKLPKCTTKLQKIDMYTQIY